MLKQTYRLVEELASGGMGTVFLAEHKTLPRRFAVKLLRAEQDASTETLKRFEREATIASSLGHPNIVEVVDFDRTPEGEPFLVMELLEGEDLAAYLAARGPLTPDQLLPVLRQICSALVAAHAAEIVHRDLKPQNIFLHSFGGERVVKVLDFGISKMKGLGTQLTRDNAFMGTPNYMAPEQIRAGADTVDSRADQFSLGAIVFECLTGKLAFGAGGLPEVVHAICYGDRPHSDAIPEPLVAVVNRMLSVEPGDRYASVKEAWTALALGLGQPQASLSTASGLDVGAALAATRAAPVTGEESTLAGPITGNEATVAGLVTGDEATLAADSVEAAEALASVSKTVAADPAPDDTHPPTRKEEGLTQVPAVVPPRWRMGLFGLGVGLLLVVGVVLYVFMGRAPSDTLLSFEASAGQVPTGTQKRPRAAVQVRVALMKVGCSAAGSELIARLRELRSGAGMGKLALVPQDEVDQAAKQLGGSSVEERALGRRLGAALVLGGRCEGAKLRARLVRVSDGVVLATRSIDAKPTAESVTELGVTLSIEQLKLEVALETRSTEALQHYRRFLALRSKGVDLMSAVQIPLLLKRVLKADPTWDRPRVELAEYQAMFYILTMDRGQLTAIPKLIAPLLPRPKRFAGRIRCVQAQVAFWRFELDKARRLLLEATVLAPDNSLITLYLYLSYLLSGEDNAATRVLRKGIVADPGFGLFHVQLVTHLFYMGQLSEAEAASKSAIAMQLRQRQLGNRDPLIRRGYLGLAGAFAERGFIRLAQGKPKEAVDDFQAELRHLQGLASLFHVDVEARTRFGLGFAYRRLGRKADAAKELKKGHDVLGAALSLQSDRGYLLLSIGPHVLPFDPQMMLDLVQKWYKPVPPLSHFFVTMRAAALHCLGKHAAARAQLSKSLAAVKARYHSALKRYYQRFVDQHAAVTKK